MHRFHFGALGAAAALVIASAANAYSVSPLRMLLEPVGTAAAGRIEIRNSEARPITISVIPQAIALDDRGTVTTTAADADLLVFPPQMVIQPGQSQAVQVRYTGEATIDSARLFTARVEQEPVDLQSGQEAQLKMGVTFVTAILVQPKGAAPALVVTGFRPAPGGVAVDLRNDGKGAARIPALSWELKGGGGAPIAASGSATGFGESGFLLPGGRRTVLIPVAAGAENVIAVAAGRAAD